MSSDKCAFLVCRNSRCLVRMEGGFSVRERGREKEKNHGQVPWVGQRYMSPMGFSTRGRSNDRPNVYLPPEPAINVFASSNIKARLASSSRHEEA